MTRIDPTARTGLAAITAIAENSKKSAESRADRQSIQNITPAGAKRLSPRSSDALMVIKELTAKPAATTPAPEIEPSSGPIVSSEGFSREEIEWFRSLGADAWVRNEPPERLDDAEFQRQVYEHYFAQIGNDRLPGLAEAIDKGTLRILRAEDVPELEIRQIDVTFYKNGNLQGGASYGFGNDKAADAMRAKGTFVGTGAILGNDYVVMWPMPNAAETK